MERKARIIIIDDDKNLAQNICDILVQENYLVNVAYDGSEGILKCQNNVYDIALIDVKLPDIIGNEVVKKITELSPKTECILMTGHASLENAILAVEQKTVVAYEIKPLDMDHILALLCQIIKRKSLEKELTEQKDFLGYVINSMPGIFYTFGQDERFLLWNKNFEQITGYSSEELQSKRFTDFFTNESRENIAKWIKKAFIKGQISMDEMLTTKKGSQIPFLLSGNRIKFRNRQYIVGLGIDLTERKKLEEQLRQSQKMEVVGQLVGGMAHDFNNMLNVIIGSAELAYLKLNHMDPVATNLQMIKDAAKRSAELISQLMTFSRKQIINPQPAEINDVIDSIKKMIGRLIGEDIDLIFIPGKDIWKIKVDFSQINQVMINLAVNARDAIAKEGTLTIKTTNITFEEDYCSKNVGFIKGQFIMISINDSGKGMDEETLSHIFEPFFTTKKQGKGTGLGLSIVYGIATQNNWLIKVYSKLGVGTTFEIYIPRWIGKKKQNKISAKKLETSKTGTILLVEDDDMVREMTMKMLTSVGYSVITASSPDQAISYCKKDNFDFQLLLTDVIMPKMNGKELRDTIELIRPGIKTLFMSGYSANVIAHRNVSEHGVNFIQKPFHLDELIQKIQESLLK